MREVCADHDHTDVVSTSHTSTTAALVFAFASSLLGLLFFLYASPARLRLTRLTAELNKVLFELIQTHVLPSRSLRRVRGEETRGRNFSAGLLSVQRMKAVMKRRNL